ncbi:MAG: TolB-like protein, partial [Woeseiaceae bacterium]
MSFFAELKRRNVVRVGVAYAVIGWALAQVAEFAVENFGAPDWTLKIFVVFLMLGLPLALFFAWAFEITPEGVKREKDVDRSQSVTAQTGRKLDFTIIVVLVFAVGFLLIDKFVTEDLLPAPDQIVATQSQSIAVLPFVNMSNDDDHFADGLSEELLNLLAKIPNLKVAGRTSSFVFKGRNEDFQAIGDALKVEHVLEGSVRRSGDTLRVTAQLIKVDDGYHVWSETYDRKLEDVFAIQDDVAGAITSELKLRLAPTADRTTSNTEAYALYLQALALSSATQYSEALGQAQVLLDGAIALDENFAKAYELKASFYWMASAWTLDAPTGQLLAYEAAVRALALDPSLPGARSFASTANPDNWSWMNEILALEELVKAEPNNMLALTSFQYDLIEAGYFSGALPVADRMIELEPLSAVGYFRRGEVLYALGRREEARESWARAAEFG